MNTLVDHGKAPPADLVQPCIAADGQLGVGGLPRPP